MAVNPLMEGARSVLDARSAGIDGINAASNGVADAAREIAQLNGADRPADAAPAPDAADALTDLRVYRRQVQAAAVVVQTADAVVGFLLDVRA